MKREDFVAVQLWNFKKECNLLLSGTIEEHFALVDEHAAMRNQFMRDEPIDFGHFMCLTTRLKIHIIAHRALKLLRNFDFCDLSRLPKLVALHRSQLKRLGTVHYKSNAIYYEHMEQRLFTLDRYLRALKS